MATWNERLRKRREELGIPQAEFARLTDVKQPTVYEWEEGITKNLKGKNLMRVCAVLRCSPDWLLTGKGFPETEMPSSDQQAREPTAPYPAQSHLSKKAAQLVASFEVLTPAVQAYVLGIVDALALPASIRYQEWEASQRALNAKRDKAPREKKK